MFLSFVDERQFLTMIQLVLSFHECADFAPIETAAEPLHSVADSVATEEATAVEPLYSAADPSGSGASQTETFCLCVRV
jgi:hypothetical protein